MSLINCIPCEIILESTCFSSRNYVNTCVPGDGFVASPLPLPFFCEGYVADDGFSIADIAEVKPGPHITTYNSTTSAWEDSLAVCSWDEATTLFYYDSSDTSAYKSNYDTTLPYRNGNEHFASQINSVVGDLLDRSSYFSSSLPYNSEIYYILKTNPSLMGTSLSEEARNILDFARSPSSYYFKNKYLNQLLKSILYGKFERCFPSSRLEEIQSTDVLYTGKNIPTLSRAPVTVSSINTSSAEVSSTNLESVKEYVRSNRIPLVSNMPGESLQYQTLRKYWKFIPSDIYQRIKFYKKDVAASASDFSVAVNDDYKIPVYPVNYNGDTDTIKRAGPLNAENLKVFTLGTPTSFQKRCGNDISGCNIYSDSSRDRAYCFNPQDRTILFGLLGALSGFPLYKTDLDSYLKLSVSAPFASEFEFAQGSVSSIGGGTASSVSAWPGGGFYFLTPSLSGTDTLGSTQLSAYQPSEIFGETSGDVTTSTLIQTTLQYTVHQLSSWNDGSAIIDRDTRFVAGPGKVFFVDHNDPIVCYLNTIGSAKNSPGQVSATTLDLNLDNILLENEIYPRQIPQYIVVVPGDITRYNPFCSTSKITKMIDPDEPGSIYPNGYIERTLRGVPAPILDVLNSNPLEVKLLSNVSYFTDGSPSIVDQFPSGVQGNEDPVFRMVWRARDNYSSLSYASIQEIFPTFSGVLESSRQVGPVRKVFDGLQDANPSAHPGYDARTDITSGVLGGTTIKDNYYYPVTGTHSLPKFDVWRRLSIFEFNEFISSFKDDIFNNVTSGLVNKRYRNLEIFNSVASFPEKTYLHTYNPGQSLWSTSETYGGGFYNSILNLRNASGSLVDVTGVPIREAEPRRYLL
tara:strand:- start:243 stop:2810 length:2568 start_codon:yes stop_codon:yes gene_type:complete